MRLSELFCVVLCILKLCTVTSTLRLAVLTVLWIGLCHSGVISLCLDSFVFMSVYCVYLFPSVRYMCCVIGTF